MSLTKKQMVICLRNSLEIYIDAEIAETLMDDLHSGRIKGFIKIAGRMLNVVDISAVVPPEDMIDLSKRRNGQWRCDKGVWHDRGTKCDCIDNDLLERNKRIAQAIKDCGKCHDGYVQDSECFVTKCDCIKNL